MMSASVDVIAFLKEQHEQIKELFARVKAAEGKAKEEAFFSLRRLLAVHETAEEEIIHPAARRVLPDGDSVIDARLQEENKAKKVLSKLEAIELDSPEFKTEFELLERSVVMHAAAEEREEFARLSGALDPDRLERMRTVAEFAEKTAPTRPHPGVESPAANLLMGPFAAMLDRARDAITGKNPS
jgi:hemerythrin superfamily protein